MPKRSKRVSTMFHDSEWSDVVDAAERRGLPPSRFVREAVVAAARGVVLPAHWLSESIDIARDLSEQMSDMRTVMPDDWERTLQEFMVALGGGV